MDADQEQVDVTQAKQPPRTGPVGRLARLLLAVTLGWVVYDLWVDRTFIFDEADPGLLILTGFAVYAVYHTAGLVGLAWPASVATTVTLVGSAVIAVASEGTVWASPLSQVVWGLDFGVVLVIAAALLVAVVVGTPGCEVGVFRDVVRRVRREPGATDVPFCLVGLHWLDAWEARQPWRHRGRTANNETAGG